MNNLEFILEDFYNLFCLSICFIDENFSIKAQKNQNKEFYKLLEEIDIINLIKKENISNSRLMIFDNLNFLVVKSKHLNIGYFLIGPFTTNNFNLEINVPKKPEYCIDYIGFALEKIIYKNTTNKQFNFYVKKSIEFIHKNYQNDIKIENVCELLNINKCYFCTLFKKDTGYTFTNFVNRVRIEKSKEFLRNDTMSVLDVSLSVGFNNQNYYTSLFKKLNNITPLDYKKNYKLKKESSI